MPGFVRSPRPPFAKTPNSGWRLQCCLIMDSKSAVDPSLTPPRRRSFHVFSALESRRCATGLIVIVALGSLAWSIGFWPSSVLSSFVHLCEHDTFVVASSCPQVDALYPSGNRQLFRNLVDLYSTADAKTRMVDWVSHCLSYRLICA